MRQYSALFAFNRGIVSPLGLARTDQKRVALSAEVMTNWMPRVLGSMSFRPGLGYLGSTNDDAKPRYIPFVFATDDTALIEFTDGAMRVWIDDQVLTRAAVDTEITNGSFTTTIAGWTDGSEAGASIAWDSGNMMKLVGTGTAKAIGYQAVTVASADQATEHGLNIVITRGPVTFKCGTTLGDDDLIGETVLDTGRHSLAFTPNAGTFYVQFSSTYAYKVRIARCVVEAAGAVSLVSPYATADLGNIRFDQSADTVFLACAGQKQQKIERRGTRPGARSWSICDYHADDGPFRAPNITSTTLTATATTGDTTLTASRPVFSSDHVGAIFSLTNQVAGVSKSMTSSPDNTSSLKVTGTGTNRSITITLTGTWVATVTLQVSSDNVSFSDVPGYVWNGTVTGPYIDGLDAQTRYYRLGTTAWTSGTVQAALTFTSGTITGVTQVVSVTSSTVATVRVLSDIGSTSATTQWSEGSWSDFRGWPTAVRLHEGRLWWAGQNGIFGSVSDSYFSYDENVLGDAGPINRTIGSGPVDTVNWMVSLQRLLLGCQGAEFSVKSSAFDSPLTPTDFSVKRASTQGSSSVEIEVIDQRAVYVDRSGIKVFELTIDGQSYEYGSNDLTSIIPELGSPGIVRLAVQRKPDTRIHCVRSDGTVMVGVYDKVEEVMCWVEVETDGVIEDVVTLPGENGEIEDQVYYAVMRTINGSTVRFLEKWAKETECRGTFSDTVTLNKQADAYVTGTNSPASATINGLSHLEGEDVVVWADGVDFSEGFDDDQTTYTVSGGAISLGESVTDYVVGLPYTGEWKSSKLGVQVAATVTVLNQQKRISHIGIVAAWLHATGLQFGPDFDNMNDLPGIEQGAPVDSSDVREMYDEQEIPFPGVWAADARLCLKAQAPRPATILAAVPDLAVHD